MKRKVVRFLIIIIIYNYGFIYYIFNTDMPRFDIQEFPSLSRAAFFPLRVRLSIRLLHCYRLSFFRSMLFFRSIGPCLVMCSPWYYFDVIHFGLAKSSNMFKLSSRWIQNLREMNVTCWADWLLAFRKTVTIRILVRSRLPVNWINH